MKELLIEAEEFLREKYSREYTEDESIQFFFSTEHELWIWNNDNGTIMADTFEEMYAEVLEDRLSGNPLLSRFFH